MYKKDYKNKKKWSWRNKTADVYEDALGKVKFTNYKHFTNVNDAYSSFIQKYMEVIDKVLPLPNKRIKRNSGWLDSEISEKLIIWDKLFKKYKKLGFM